MPILLVTCVTEIGIRFRFVAHFIPSVPLKLVLFAEKPDPPQDLVKGKVFYDQQNRPNIKVVWKPPKYDGGSEISHYIVEYKTVKTEWSTAANATVEKTEYSMRVKKSETYTVRVTAVNKLSVGEPATITIKFTG